MNWLLVFFIANAPVKSDLVFPTLSACMAYERANAAVLVDRLNQALKSLNGTNISEEERNKYMAFWTSQVYAGTCIPTVSPVTVPKAH